MVEHSEARNEPSTVKGNRITLKVHVLPALGRMKVAEVKRSDVADLIGKLRGTPTAANNWLSLLRKMFNLAELWASGLTARTRVGISRSTPARSGPG